MRKFQIGDSVYHRDLTTPEGDLLLGYITGIVVGQARYVVQWEGGFGRTTEHEKNLLVEEADIPL